MSVRGLSGGTIVVKKHSLSKLKSHENAIVGNTVFYGATSGNLFISGLAGEEVCSKKFWR